MTITYLRLRLDNAIKPVPSADLDIPEETSEKNNLLREPLALRIPIAPLVRELDSSLAEREGFLRGSIVQLYRNSITNKDHELSQCLKKSAENLSKKAQRGPIASIPKEKAEDPLLFLSLKPLGQGSFHTVSTAILRNGSLVAASVPKSLGSSVFEPKAVKFLEALKDCPNIIQLIGYERGCCYYEIGERNLESLLEIRSPFYIGRIGAYRTPVFSVMLGILEGGVQMADRKVIHLDLKPENIIMVGNTPKICDFDTATWADRLGFATEAAYLKGNVFHYSPERSAECCKEADTLPGWSDDCFVGVQDNVWGLMLIISKIACEKLPSRIPQLNLSPGFKHRANLYFNKIALESEQAATLALRSEVKKGRLTEQAQQKHFWRKAFCRHIFEQFGGWNGNLFGKLAPETGLDFVIKKMAMFHPGKRIRITEARDLMRAIKEAPDAVMQLIGIDQNLQQIDQEIAELEKQLAPLKANSENPAQSQSSKMPEILKNLTERLAMLIEQKNHLENKKNALFHELKN